MNRATEASSLRRRDLIAIAITALALRLAWVLVIDPTPTLDGGDAPFYLQLGKALATGKGLAASHLLAVGPAYPLFISIFYLLLPEAWAVQGVRLTQAVIDSGSCLVVALLCQHYFGDRRVSNTAALLLAFDLRFITQAGAINTETLFIALMMIGMWTMTTLKTLPGTMAHVINGLVWLAATLTRAVVLPLSIILYGALMIRGPIRRHLKQMALAGGIALTILGAWSAWLYAASGKPVVVSDGFAGNFWMGSRGDGQWPGIVQFQQELDDLKARYGGREAYLEDAFKIIAADPLAYGKLLFVKAARAYAQPHGTVTFGGESLKEITVRILRGEASVAELLSGDAFLPKLYIYIFHYIGIGGGLIGFWLNRRRPAVVLPLALPIIYFSGIYTLLTIIPRYIFPIMPFYLMMAAYAAIAAIDSITAAHVSRRAPQHSS